MDNEKYNLKSTITREDVEQGKNSHTRLLQMIMPQAVVLECGPAYGVMTKYLKETLGCTVYILEIDNKSFSHAIQFADGGICADLETDTWMNELSVGAFDYIIFADVLEHLHDPEKVLEKMKCFLKPSGTVLMSVPNIAYGDIVLNLLCDRFTYTPTGLLDNTHIHLFARENLHTMIQNAGYYLAKESSIRLPLLFSEQGAFLSHNEYERWKPVLTDTLTSNIYQFIYQLSTTEVPLQSDIGDSAALQARYQDHLPNEIHDFKCIIEQKENYIQEQRQCIYEKDGEVRELKGIIEQKENYIQEQRQWIGEKDDEVRELKGIIEQKENYIQEQRQWIGEKDDEVRELKGVVEQKENYIQEQRQKLAGLRDVIEKIEKDLVELRTFVGQFPVNQIYRAYRKMKAGDS